MTDQSLTAAAGAPGPSAVIQPPQLTPPRISLLSSADVVTDSGTRWENGYTYSPEGCGEGAVGALCPNAGDTKTFCLNPSIVEFVPFFVYSSDKCSAFSFKERDYFGRATRKLLAAESWFLENELMLDTLALNNHPIISPAATVVSAGALPPLTALSAVEDALGDCSRGGRYMIHVRPGVFVALAGSQSIRREGNVWLTPLDNIVVPGRGYPGTGPTGQAIGTSEWIYATSMVQIRRGPVLLTPEQGEQTKDNPQGIPTSAVDRGVNDIMVIAERIVSAAYDPSCCVIAAEVSRS